MENTGYLRSASKGIFPVLMAFYVMGFGDIVGVATGYTQLEFGLSNTLTQMLTMLAFVWFALLSIPISIFQDKRGRKYTVNLGILCFGIAMFLPIVFYNYYGMLLSFACLGIGNAIVQVSANPLMQDVSPPDKLSRNLTLSQFVKAIAGMLGPFIAAFCALYFHNWTIVYWIYLAVCVITFCWLYATPIQEAGGTGKAGIGRSLGLLKDSRVVWVVLGTFLMVGFDVGMNTNIVRYLRDSFQVSQEEGSIGISIYFLALMVGRFLSALLLNKWKTPHVLISCAVLSLLSFGLMFLAADYLFGQISIFLVGLFSAAIFPLVFSIGLQYFPDRSNELSGLMIMSVCGGGIIPPLLGFVSDCWSFMPAFFLYGACLLYVLIFSLKVWKV